MPQPRVRVPQREEVEQIQRERAEYLDLARRRALRIVQLSMELRRTRAIAYEAIAAGWRELHAPSHLPNLDAT